MAAAQHSRPDPETWVDEHGDYLYRVALVRLGSKADAEDAVQETLLAAVKGYDRYDGSSPIRAWLTGILKHKVVDHIRKASRMVSTDQFDDEGITDKFIFKAFGIPERNPPDWGFDPRKSFEQKEFMEYLYDCMTELKGPLRQAFILRELEGISTEEICKEIGVTPNNLWVMLHRTRNQLKTCLEVKWLRQEAS
ncbi:MAG: sigma-70 family RNA polymerase sigma factor [Verrucomicrobia bacterium]|mgnify:CR=1 FL=1|nr:sigma-70 family RNA polymerase sigma factor [Kiritimatiellia bacterium]MCP5489148.1 sigma-70 family RNA polymerase sigma factor [Verrucomicrobiota bacterium]